MIWNSLRGALLACILPALLLAQAPKQLHIAAASDLQAALPDIVRDFERSAAVRVTVSYGSSGNFFAQIQNGAPFDVFLSADVDYPRQLADAGLADRSTLQLYATGHLVVWARRESKIDLSRGLASLTDPRVRHVALANPKYAPYGRAAEAALRYERIYDAVRGKLVLGENISQTAQLVDSGNATVGIIALSVAVGPTLRAHGTYIEIPAAAHPPIDQAAVIVSASARKPLASEFLAYLKRPQVSEYLHTFGFAAGR